jgi:iron complex transport system ATP-binding protein
MVVTAAAQPVIGARGLAIGYAMPPLIADIDIACRPGEIVCLLGSNGSGKTTLFKTLLGLLPALGGTVAVDGSPLHGRSRQEIARRIAYVPQAHTSMFPFLVLDMVLMGRTSHLNAFAVPGRADREAAWHALDVLGIADLAQLEYTRISGGQRQLVLVARALAQEAPAIVMDEPTASLDFGNQALVLTQVKRLAAQGLGVLLSTHHPDHAFALADHVMLLRAGSVLAQGRPFEVLTPRNLEHVYGTAVAVERLSDGRVVCVPKLDWASSPRS